MEDVLVNVSLTPELEQLIQERVRSGRYTSASEVVREALRLLQDRDELRRLRIEELRVKVAAGLDSLDRGEGVDGDAAIDEILSDEPRAS
jgi:antitoxin ParD1/3/4